MRLNRFLSAAGVCSRREADRLIGEGAVSVNGTTASLGMNAEDEDIVLVRGKRVRLQEKELYLAVNKPRGFVVTTDRSHGDRLLEELVPDTVRVFPVGRLDKESEGLILMTNNGDAANRIQKSAGCHEKEYQVTVDRAITGDFLKKMSEGVYLEELGRTTRRCRVRRIDVNRFDIILTEGMNRQIRRMCGALGYKVEKLRRVRVMNILIGDLGAGKYRELTENEVRELKEQLYGDKPGRKQRREAQADGRGTEGR